MRLNQTAHLSHYIPTPPPLHTRQPLLITSPSPLMHTLRTHLSPFQPVLEVPDMRPSIKGLSLNESALTNYLSIRLPPSIYAPHPLSPPSIPLLYVFYNPPFHPYNKH